MQAKISWLFESSALKIAPADKPFFYTSGLIGPYYINTHYLCGGPQKAEEVLSFIDTHQEPRSLFPPRLEAELIKVKENSKIYSDVIEAFAACVRQNIAIEEIDFISGGQRRDWFFAPMVAKSLNLPCLYIYSDLGVIESHGAKLTQRTGAKVLNVADLLTVASSYTTKWIPALQQIGAKLLWSVNGVDRQQGGVANLMQAGLLGCYSLFSIDLDLFVQARDQGFIDSLQFGLVQKYLKDPFDSMRSFLVEHPEFLSASLNSADLKLKARAELMVKEDLYRLGFI